MKYTKEYLTSFLWSVDKDPSGNPVYLGLYRKIFGGMELLDWDEIMLAAAIILANCNADWIPLRGGRLDQFESPENLLAIWAGISTSEASVIIDRARDSIECPVRQEADKTRQQLVGMGVLPANDVVHEGLRQAQLLCHKLASKSGWWTDRATGNRKTRDQVNIAEKLCLIHSEISEAMEGDRKDLNDDHLPHRKMLEVELADALIRIFDLGGFLELDLAGATLEKLAYNQQRADHKLANRNEAGGKAY